MKRSRRKIKVKLKPLWRASKSRNPGRRAANLFARGRQTNETLTPPDRLAIQTRFDGGERAEDLARDFNCGIKTIYTSLHRRAEPEPTPEIDFDIEALLAEIDE